MVQPGINGTNLAVVARGARLRIDGFGFLGTSSVTIAGAMQPFTVQSDTSIMVEPAALNVNFGIFPLVVTNPAGSSNAYQVTVVHLVINEVELDPAEGDAMENGEFVEVATRLDSSATDLASYSLVYLDGEGKVAWNTALGTTPASGGKFLVGGTAVNNRQATLPRSSMFNPDGVFAIIQGTGGFGMGTDISTITQPFIDVMVTGTPAMGVVNAAFRGVTDMAARTSVSESATDHPGSISRCPVDNFTRMDGRSFRGVAVASPGGNNNCP